MLVQNASPLPNLPNGNADDKALPPVLTTDRGFWNKGIAPEGGPITVKLPAGVVPEFDAGLLANVCATAIKSYNSTLIFDVESGSLALSDSDAGTFGDWLNLLIGLRDGALSNGVKDVSFFGLPFTQNPLTQFNSTLATWTKRSAALGPLLGKCTSLSPCLYSAGMDLYTFAAVAGYVVSLCRQFWPGIPVCPFISARQGFEGTAGAYDDSQTFYQRLAILRALGCPTLRYWDANFAGTNFTSLSQTPVYNLLRLANQYPDLTWPPTDAGRPGGSAFFTPWPPTPPPVSVPGSAGH